MKKKYLQGNARERIFINIGLRAKLNEKGYFLFVYFLGGQGLEMIHTTYRKKKIPRTANPPHNPPPPPQTYYNLPDPS